MQVTAQRSSVCISDTPALKHLMTRDMEIESPFHKSDSIHYTVRYSLDNFHVCIVSVVIFLSHPPRSAH